MKYSEVGKHGVHRKKSQAVKPVFKEIGITVVILGFGGLAAYGLFETGLIDLLKYELYN